MGTKKYVSLVISTFLMSMSRTCLTQALETTGSVAGQISCNDTGRPAKFARVILFGIPASVVLSQPKTGIPTGDVSGQQVHLPQSGQGQNFIETEADSEGNFELQAAPKGYYYLFASLPGYVTPLNQVQAAIDNGADLASAIDGVPIIQVIANRLSQANLVIVRGASIYGTITWDDGSPVGAGSIRVVRQTTSDKRLPDVFNSLIMASVAGGASQMTTTDDTGHYRLSGLTPGEYILRAEVQTRFQFTKQNGAIKFGTNSRNSPLVIFAPSFFHEHEAQKVKLQSHDSFEMNMIVPLLRLHSVSGHIESSEGLGAVNSGDVELRAINDSQYLRSVSIDKDGDYSIDLVPAGVYDLTVKGATFRDDNPLLSSGLNSNNSKVIQRYESSSREVLMGESDTDHVDISVSPARAAKP